MQEKMKAYAVPVTSEKMAQMQIVRLGESGKVTGGMIDGAPALVFHKELNFDSPTFMQDFENSDNMIVVRFGTPEQVDVVLQAIDKALTPFVEKNVEFDFNSFPEKQMMN